MEKPIASFKNSEKRVRLLGKNVTIYSLFITLWFVKKTYSAYIYIYYTSVLLLNVRKTELVTSKLILQAKNGM